MSGMYSASNCQGLPAEEVTLATIHSRRGQQWEAVWVTVSRAWSGEPYCPLTTCCRTPADGWIVFHKGLEPRGRRGVVRGNVDREVFFKLNENQYLVKLCDVFVPWCQTEGTAGPSLWKQHSRSHAPAPAGSTRKQDRRYCGHHPPESSH